MGLLDALKWRYATKKFDATKKVSTEDLNQILESMRLAASSYGLQTYKIVIVENPEIRAKLQPASWGQSQIVDASHLIVICNYTKVNADAIDAYLKLTSTTRNVPLDALTGYGDFMKNTIGGMSPEQIKIWTAKQTYIVLGNLLAMCGELKVDACPMEGFEADKYDEILGLSAKGLSAAVVATIGYRSDEDQTQHGAKVRKSNEDLFERV